MRIQLRKNSWLGKELGHPKDLGSLLWGITSRFVAWAGAVAVGILVGLFILMVNVSLYELITTSPITVVDPDTIGFGSLAIVVDAIILMIVIGVIAKEWDKIQPYWQKYVVNKWPVVEWVEEE